MWKQIGVVVGCFLLAGCNFGSPAPTIGSTVAAPGSIYKSFDAGRSFAPKVTVSEKLRITSADILSWEFGPANADTIYAGTLSDGIFRSRDGAEHWEQLVYPPEKVYGLALDPSNSQRLFATGVYEKVGKVYKSEDEGATWKEVYVEPGPGTTITALVLHPANPRVLYAATDKGVVIKSTDGGEQWKNVYQADGAVTAIVLGAKTPKTVSLLVFQKEVVSSEDDGVTWHDSATGLRLTNTNTNEAGETLRSPLSLAADPKNTAILYAGTLGGLFRSSDRGATWHSLGIIESAKKYPIRAMAISPIQSDEIVFASGSVFYRSTDGGQRWAVTELGTTRGVNVIAYKPGETAHIYFGLRKF